MSDPTIDNTVTPLPNTQKIVNADGTPTLYFIRWAQERSIDISGGVTYAQIEKLFAGVHVIAGGGLTETPAGGSLAADVTVGMPVIAPPVAGVYTNANISVDQYGRVIVAASGTGGGGGSFASGCITSAQAITKGNNIASINRLAAGVYKVNFTTAAANTNYVVTGSAYYDPYGNDDNPIFALNRNNSYTYTGKNVGYFVVSFQDSGGNLYDCNFDFIVTAI